MTQAEFNARAWQAANDKARELGWNRVGGAAGARRPRKAGITAK
jgi:hypothetical protein